MSVQDRSTAIFYTTAVCNLNCKYCYIDKNAALQKIDKILDESFQGDYYFKFVQEMFPSKGQLRRVETWGGEPFLRMDRIYDLMHSLIQYYPALESMYSSTNFSFNEWLEQFYGLMDVFAAYPDRSFTYDLQMSVDGPEYLNDYSRGDGTTKKCLANYEKLLATLGERLPPNVTLNIMFKPTLDLNSTKLLCSKEKIIEYYQFFESLCKKVWDLDYDNVHISLPVPNTACPSPVTVNDGKIFAELCRLCREIERENATEHYFERYTCITPFSTEPQNAPLTYNYPHYTCGTGYTQVGFLPMRMISACHNGFVDLISDYKQLCTANRTESTIDFDLFLSTQPLKFTMPVEEYEQYERHMGYYACPGATARVANLATQIAVLANAGQIEERYKDQAEALRGAIFIQQRTSYCVRDNYTTTGSIALQPFGLLKLLLNGAQEHIEDVPGIVVHLDGDESVDEEGNTYEC